MMETEILAAVGEYGIAGAFILYLIWDRQNVIKKMIATIDRNTKAVTEFIIAVNLLDKDIKKRYKI